MSQPLVSILMPIYNCANSGLRDGRCYLNYAIESLLLQSYRNFELIILDNQSDDRTPEICREYAQRDTRIKFISDSQKRTIDEAFAYAPKLMHGEYCMCANDDDRYHPEFVARLVSYLEQHRDCDFVYPNCDFVDSKDAVTSPRIVAPDSAYSAADSAFSNFCRYTQKRNPLPFVFGMYRAPVFRKLQPTTAFDVWGANVDNLLVLKFFLMGFRSAFIDEVLFYYRMKDRPLAPPSQSRARFPRDFPQFNEPVEVWFYYIRHQLYFRIAILRELRKFGTFAPLEAELARAMLNESLVHHCMNLMEWLCRDETKADDAINKERFAKIRALAQQKIVGLASIPWRVDSVDYTSVSSNQSYVRLRSLVAQELIEQFVEVVQFASASLGAKSTSVISDVMTLLTQEIVKIPSNAAQSARVSAPTPL